MYSKRRIESMLKKIYDFGGSWTGSSWKFRDISLYVLLMCCVGSESHAYDPASVQKMGFGWLYHLNNATGFDLLVDGSLVKGSATTLPSGQTMKLQNVSCQGRIKASCINNNVVDCIKMSLCTLSYRKALFGGEPVKLPGVFPVKASSGKAATNIKVQLQVSNGGKGDTLTVTKTSSN
jgi:hypothetical protein